MKAWFERWISWLAEAQIRRPWTSIALCTAVALAGAVFARGLELRTRFDQLLPENQPSVVELQRVVDRTGAASKVILVVEGEDSAELRRCADALVTTLRPLGEPAVARVSSGVHEERRFLRPRAGLFASLPELQKLDRDLETRWDWEVARQTGSSLDDDEPPPAFDAAEVKRRFRGNGQEDEQFPGGYFQAKDGHTVLVVATTGKRAGDMDGAGAVLEQLKRAAAPTMAGPECGGAKVGYAGDLVTGLVEYGVVRDDLVSVGAAGVLGVLLVIVIYFMRVRALVAMGVALAMGLALTFGLTRLAIGHLNVATGFLVSIVAGNGINCGIILLARYLEERRGGSEVPAALRTSVRATWPSTLSAAVAASAAYGSLGVTQFRAFKHFAFIGAAGMLVCWIATYAVMPAVLVVLERQRSFVRGGSGVRYDAPFVFAVSRFPRLLSVAGLALGLLGLGMTALYVARDPMDYDLRNVRSEAALTETTRLSTLASNVLGATLDSSMVVVVDEAAQLAPLVAALHAKRDAVPRDLRPFEAVHSLLSFVPEGQAAKVPLLASIRERLVRARTRGFVKDSEWAELEPLLPPDGLKPHTMADLPDDLARPFTDRAGQRGTVLLIEPTAGERETDLHYLLRWASSFRETRLPDGNVVRGSGRAVIFADILRTMLEDMPRALALSLVLTIASVFITFRRGRNGVAVVLALLLGVAWLAVWLYLARVRINMFNFVALPITFGIGVDYAVNLVQRYEAEPERGILGALRTSGGAVVLCSLTTTIGYLALLASKNPAIRSLGLLAVLGEVCCLLAAVLVLPAALLLLAKKASSRPPATSAGEEHAT